MELRYHVYILSFIAALVMWGCAEEAALPAQQPHSRLRLGLDPAMLAPRGRTVYYDGDIYSTFMRHDLIGAVIATPDPEGGYTYLGRACWEYDVLYSPYLTLKRICGTDETPLDPADNDILRHVPEPEGWTPDDESWDPHDIELMLPETEYCLFFYYPYTDSTTLADDWHAYFPDLSQGDKIPSERVPYPNTGGDIYWSWGVEQPWLSLAATSFQLSTPAGADRDASSTHTRLSHWTRFPVAMSSDFRSPDETTWLSRMNHNDFMWTALTGLNQSSSGTLNITLQKQTATLDLYFRNYSDDGSSPVEEVYIEPVCSEASGWQYRMPSIQYFDLSTGRFTEPYFYSQWGGDLYTGHSRYTEKIYPQQLEGTFQALGSDGLADYTVYRLLLMPQEAFDASLTFRLAGASDPLTVTRLQANPKLSTLLPGHYYRLLFEREPDDTGFHIDIEDWADGGSQTLQRP